MKSIFMVCAISISFLIVPNFNLYSQDYSINLAKECSKKKSGYYIRIKIDGLNFSFDSNKNKYDYEAVSKLPESVRLAIIEKLFAFIADTSTCSNKIYGYPNSQFDGCYFIAPNSKVFSIGIESLFIINRIAYFKYINRISCFPVLFDSQSQTEVNTDVNSLRIMGEHYKIWFNKCMSVGRVVSDYQYFNSGQIKWWGNHL